ncbi:hypothetical protein AALT_g11060 [Alternaria alternata]|nr:hypothetical protein AALT_g11060 [Alternaria alternata]
MASRLVRHLVRAVTGMLCDLSTIHLILLGHSVVLTMVVQWLRPDRTDTLLSISLGVVELAVVVDCILIVTHHLTLLSESSRTPAMVVYQMPFIIGPLSEFELARLMLEDHATAAANTFLVGCVYVKPLVAGALCLGLHGLYTGGPETQLLAADSSDVPNFFLWIWLSLMLYAYQLGFQSRSVLTAVAGNSLWLSRGVPVLLVLSVCLTCYLWSRHAGRFRAEASSDEHDVSHQAEWAMLLVGLVLLKLAAVHLVHSVWKHMQSATTAAYQDDAGNGSGKVIEFAVLPLAVSAVDHLAYISVTYRMGMEWVWANLFQSTTQTLFLIRPLFALLGHDLDPRSGCFSMGLCFFGIALWLSLRTALHKCSLPAPRNGLADFCSTAQRIGSSFGVLGSAGWLFSVPWVL